MSDVQGVLLDEAVRECEARDGLAFPALARALGARATLTWDVVARGLEEGRLIVAAGLLRAGESPAEGRGGPPDGRRLAAGGGAPRHAAADGSAVRIPTPEEIEAGRTPAGGFTRAQLAEWGVPWPPPHGWREQLEAMRRAHLERGEDLPPA